MPVFKPYPVMTAATVAALVILVLLGNWQMRRLAWKLDLIATVEARTHQPPVPLDAAVAASADGDITYTHVTASGVFDHAREIPVFGQDLDGAAGYFIYTPLIRGSAPPVIVNRGFVPLELKDPATRAQGQVEGEVTVTGLARPSRIRHAFQPANDPARADWYVADLAQMADEMGLARPMPDFIDADATPNPGGWPLGGQTIVSFRNPHLGYALTWYGLAAMLIGVYIAVHIKAGRLALRRS